MSEEEPTQGSGDRSNTSTEQESRPRGDVGGFTIESVDEARTDRAMDAVLERGGAGVSTISGEAVREAILDDVVEYFETEYEPTELGVDRPSEQAIREEWFTFEYLEQYEVVSWRWSLRPYSYTLILYDPVANERRYHVASPHLTEFETYVRSDLTRAIRQELMHSDIGPEERRGDVFETQLSTILDEQAAAVPSATLLRVVYYLQRDFVRFGKIDPLMRDPAIEDISCDGAEVPLYVYHDAYRDLETNLTFSPARLDAFVTRLAQRAGKSLTAADPLLDASLPDGSRAQFTLGNDVSLRGSTFTIRRFSEEPLTPPDLIEFGTFSLEQMAYLWLLVEEGKSILFAGGTGSGKTTSLNALTYFIPPGSKVISIEDTPELRIARQNWVRNVTRESATKEGQGAVTMFGLLEAALRQRPEFLLVGEIRANPQVAFTFFQAISTGHTAFTTFHADSAAGALRRLENEPLNIPRQMIGSLDAISIQQQVQLDDRRVRRNQQFVELVPEAEGTGLRRRHTFERNPATDAIEQSAPSLLLEEIKYERGWDDNRLDEELTVRQEVLRYLHREGITYHHDVGRVIHTFYRQPETIVSRIRADALDPSQLAYPWEE